jgi:uncharacterized membrane protein YdbT with pleckstrin-like domain
MALSKKHLYNDEEVVIDMHPHWWYLVPRGFGLVASMAVAAIILVGHLGGTQKSHDGPYHYNWWGTGLRYGSAVLVAVALLAFLARLIQWNSIIFVVTTERCIHRSGVFAKKGVEIPLDRINTVFFNQSMFERLVGAGDVGIESAGQNSRQEFADIYHPLRVQNEIYRQMEAYEDRKNDKLGAAVGASQGSVADEVAKLESLRQAGTITEEEFEAQKAKLLA